ncbi:YibE/F family protein [Sphaerochaeta halotolerans]|uniref:YibE/F family protein n=1 Tax=Sphaerochaeta halotolerans TaxID=2293840 RepID=UPI00136C8D2A|nr:YibE/F family protein [Sphaerochaeta halotolerans]MXI86064.1 YibE/F family protein [Sphaerochaeta halotolerans]
MKKADRSYREWLLLAILLGVVLLLIMIPTGFEREIYINAIGSRARLIALDNSNMYQTGVVRMGEQICTIEILSGPHAGKQTEAINLLNGKLEFDTVYEEGDIAWVLVEQDKEGEIVFTNMVSHYRFSKELLLLALFAFGLILFSGKTGVRTIISFALAFLLIWKVLIPLTLKGYEPMLVSLLVGSFLAVACLLLVAGLTKKAYAAIIGTIICSVITVLFSMWGTWYLKLHGAVMPWSESLLFAGYESMQLTKVFQAAIYLSCLGALLDLAIDISSALEEVQRHHPAITRTALIQSGLNIGRSVVGSQTTTLLLAYIGSYLTIMMVYMAQGTPVMSILNSPSVAAEILHTMVGCIALVLVAPITSVTCGYLYEREDITMQLAPQSCTEKQITGTTSSKNLNTPSCPRY